MTKDHLLRETKKLISILESLGNVLVPTIEGQKETFAVERLEFVVEKLQSEHNLTLEQIDEEMLTLD
jgi:hypothetical protein